MFGKVFGRKGRKPMFPATYAVRCSCTGTWGYSEDYMAVMRQTREHNVDRMNPYICDGKVVRVP